MVFGSSFPQITKFRRRKSCQSWNPLTNRYEYAHGRYLQYIADKQSHMHESKKVGKDQEPLQSSTTNDPGCHLKK